MNKIELLNLKFCARWIGLSIICVVLAACGVDQKSSVDESPVEIREVNYQRVVSLAPSITEILFALEQGDKVVGVTQYCDYPPEAQSREIVGGYATPSIEAIVRCEPDIVALLKEHFETANQLEQLDIPYVTVDHINIASIRESIGRLGTILQADTQAQVLLDEMDIRMERIHTLTKDQPRPRVLVSVGRHAGEGVQSLFIAGPGNYFDDLITLAGGTNAYEGAIPYPNISAEGAIQMNPDVIIDIVPDLASEEIPKVAKDWQTIAELDAVQSGRVYVLGGDYVAVPGPRFVLVLEQMARAFHPDVEWDTP